MTVYLYDLVSCGCSWELVTTQTLRSVTGDKHIYIYINMCITIFLRYDQKTPQSLKRCRGLTLLLHLICCTLSSRCMSFMCRLFWGQVPQRFHPSSVLAWSLSGSQLVPISNSHPCTGHHFITELQRHIHFRITNSLKECISPIAFHTRGLKFDA